MILRSSKMAKMTIVLVLKLLWVYNLSHYIHKVTTAILGSEFVGKYRLHLPIPKVKLVISIS